MSAPPGNGSARPRGTVLVETCARLAATGDVPALIDAVLNGVIAAIPAYSTTYFSCDVAGTITPTAHASRDPTDTLERCRAAHPPLPVTSPVVRQFAEAPGGSEGHVLLSLDRPEHRALVRDSSLAWHDRFGIKWVLVCPMHAGARVIGYVGVRTADPVGFSATDTQTLEALAEQLALAVRTAELADEARGRAVEEERRRLAEDRAREASATNETLLRTLSSLVTQQDSDVFAARVMEVFAQCLRVRVVELWDRPTPATTDVVPRLLYFDGATRAAEEIGHPMLAGFRVPTVCDLDRAAIDRRHIISERLSGHAEIPPGMAEWYQVRFGVETMINMPLIVGGRVVGACVALAPADHTVSDAQLELGHALAHQLSLAVQFSRLSEQAKHAAVLEAQEHHARERAADLERVNALLRRGVERVSASGNLEGVLTGFLQDAKDAVGAYCAAAFQNVGGTAFEPVAVIIGARPLSPADITASPLFAGYAERAAADPSGLFAAILKGERLFLRVDRCEPCWWKELLDYHESVGNQTAWHLPMLIHGRVIGYMVLGMPRLTPPTDPELQLLGAVAQHMTLAVELARLTGEARRAAVLEERTRLARDIHDTLAQGFLGVLLHLETARRDLTAEPDRATRAIDHAYGLAKTNLDEARRSVRALRAKEGGMTDLLFALNRLTRDAAADGLVPIHFQTDATACPVPAAVGEQVLRITGEAIQNARKHARPDRIVVSLVLTDGEVRAVVSDDGTGFAPAEPAPEGRYGLLGMRERATAAGCDLFVTSAPGRGTTITVVWPGRQ